MLPTRRLASGLALIGALSLAAAPPLRAQEDRPTASTPAGLTKKLGTVKSIAGNAITLKADSGPDFTATVQDTTRILRIPPGQTDLKNATPIPLQQVQTGDRMLVRGKAGETPDLIVALQIVVMSKTDVAQKQQQDIQDWQKRGVGGLVSAIDAAAGTLTVAVTPSIGYTIKISKTTGFLRYAPNSIKFADAQKGSFDQIKAGDQLRARGDRSADGKEVDAEEVISGTFRNIAGTVTATDAANNSITVKDLLAKKTVVVRLNADSQMRKLPLEAAQGIALRLKSAGGAPGNPATAGPSAQAAGSASSLSGPSGAPAGANPAAGSRQGRGASADFQTMMSRLPAVTLADLKKDDAVLIVSTLGTGGSEVTAITLLSGVEPVLTASPNGMGAAALLSGWNLSVPGGGDTAP